MQGWTVDPIYGCWLWTGPTNDHGYPVGFRGGKHYSIHKDMWVARYGAVPDGMELDHTCRVRACVRPDHRELVSRQENLKRRNPRRREKLKQCKNGHDLGRYSIRTPEGGFVCKRCE